MRSNVYHRPVASPGGATRPFCQGVHIFGKAYYNWEYGDLGPLERLEPNGYYTEFEACGRCYKDGRPRDVPPLDMLTICEEERGLEFIKQRPHDTTVISCIGGINDDYGFKDCYQQRAYKLLYPPFDRAVLDELANLIERSVLIKQRVVVYCGFGVERSPLAVAYWIMSLYHYSWDEAYSMIKAFRDDAIDCRSWVDG